MNLRDLVGRMAIRTDKVREVMPWEMERAFRLDFMVPVPIFDREKYMDEPVRILAVEGTQVVPGCYRGRWKEKTVGEKIH